MLIPNIIRKPRKKETFTSVVESTYNSDNVDRFTEDSSYNKTKKMHYFSNLFLGWNSTCFGQFLCPSTGI
jgi:hypothetical protein